MMILKRIASGLRKQDWATVFVELILVVAGVLIALEFDTWNQERQDREEEQEYLIRLHDDMTASVALFEENIAANQMVVNRIGRVIEALKTGDLSGLPESQLREDMMLAGWRGTGFVDSTLDELISTGRITLIEDTDLRKAIARLRFETDRVDRAVENLGEGLLSTFTARGNYIDAEIKEGRLRANTPLDAMIGDPKLLSTLTQIVYLMAAMNVYLGTGQDEAERMQTHLKQSLGRDIGP